MLTNFPNGVASFGMPVLGGGFMTTGDVFFVGSTRADASDSNTGEAPGAALATIDAAVGKCTANQGDTIIVMPGHIETVSAAAGLALDVAGVNILGLGQGSLRPTVNFTTVVGADMDVDAANILMQNILFTGGFDALTGPIDINAADFAMISCETRDVTGQATDFIVGDANADRFLLKNWVHRGASAAGAQSACQLIGGDNATIEKFWIDGNFGTACIENVTTAAVNLRVIGGPGGSYARTRNAADVIFAAVATATGQVGPDISCRLQDDAINITEAFVGADMNFYNPIGISNADGQAGLNTNIVASADA